MKKLIGRIEPVMHLQGHLNAVPGGVFAPSDETEITYIVRDENGETVPSELVVEESTAATKIIQLLVSLGGDMTDEEIAEIEAEVDRLLNETDPVELGNLAGHSIVNKIRLAQTYRDDVISAIEAKGISAADKQPFRTVADLVEQIIRQAKTVTPTTEEQIVVPDEGVYGLESVTVEGVQLQELNVWATEEVQEFYPDEGYLGFSKVIVDAADFGGGDGGGDIVIDGGAAEDMTFGDDYYAPTGNYDYSAGADENPHYIPEIPGGEYKILFRKELKAGEPFVISIDGSNSTIICSSDAYIYAAWGWRDSGDVGAYQYQQIVYVLLYSNTSMSFTIDGQTKYTQTSSYGSGCFYDIYVSSSWRRDIPLSFDTPISGCPVFSVGQGADADAVRRLIYGIPNSSDYDTDNDEYIAFCSATQILYDGSNINNVDGSPMTIYECKVGGKNTWVEVGSTDGDNYPVVGCTLVWNSHDLLGMDGTTITQEKSATPIAEMSEGEIGIPVERNETYTIEGSTVNTFVGAAQRVTGGKTPLSPTDAAQALDNYYNNPAEEGKW